MLKIGIIGGSGIYNIPAFKITPLPCPDKKLIDEISLDTPYGKSSSGYSILKLDKVEIVFLNRHGIGHNIAPHKINYRANIWGFKEIGVTKIISICAVGGINKAYVPGDIVFPDQIIDVTSGRAHTFHESQGDLQKPLYHIDFSRPFCPHLRDNFIRAASTINQPIHDRGTYIATNGPRLESSAEIKYYSIIGADMVGMTGMPEAVLARELELCYASCAIITNYAAGIKEQPLTVKEVITTMKQAETRLNILLEMILTLLLKDEIVDEGLRCSCNNALKDAGF